MAHRIGYVSSRLALYKPARHALVDPRAAFFANWDREADNANVDLLCAEMSRLAYADRATVRESLQRPGFTLVDFIGGESPWARLRYRGTQGFVARNDDGVTILAFRGTESNRFEDVLADLRLRLEPWPGSEARVHAGFRSCYLAVRKRLHLLLASGADGSQRPRTLLLTGHSLGGALATLAAVDLKASGVEVGGVVSFGSPLVGDDGLRRLLAGITVRRYVDCCDLVARVPPERLDREHVRALLDDLTSHRWPRDSFEGRVVPRLGRAVSKLFSAAGGPPDYAHVDTLVYVDRQGRTSQAMRPEDRLVDQDAARREYGQVGDGADRVGVRDLADHAPINYVSALAGRVEASAPRLYTRDEVLAAERAFVDERRDVHGQKPLSVDAELRGLCLSGGGIRSATFCLGVLQALAKHGHLARFDYLCTVSGGGYIGTLLTSLLTRTRAAVKREPWREKTRVGLDDASFPLTALGADEPDRLAKDTQLHVRNQMHHLRTHSEYLMTHRGLLSRDLLRAFGQLGGGIVYTLVTYLLLLGMVVTALHLLVASFDPDLRLLQPGDPIAIADAGKLGAAAYVKAFAAEWWQQRIATPLHPVLAAALPEWRWCAIAFALGLFWAFYWLLWAEQRTERLANEKPPDYTTQRAGWSADDQREANVVRQFNVISVAAMAPFAAAAVYFTTAGGQPTWYAALLLPIAFAIGGLVTMIGAVAASERFGRHDNSQRDRRRRSVRGAMIGSAWLGLVVAALVPILMVTIAALANLPLKLLQAVVMLVGGYLMARRPTKKEGRFGALRIGARPALTLVTVAFLLVTASGFSQLLLKGYGAVGILDSMAAVAAFAIFAFLLLTVGVAVDANRASPHYFYRDRLTEAYLQTVSPVERGDGGKEQGRPVMLLRNDEDLLLRDAGILEDERGRRQQGPYHLLVTALNLRGSDELNRRSFLSDHFVFSRGFVGSSITGFARTDEYDGGQLRLARPMAISAAAVGPSAGFHTFWAQAFFATLFNARLGYWMENPWWAAQNGRLGRRDRKGIFWPAYLLSELMGKTNARHRLINLSDGGHTGDNLGLMPLIERGCDTIVVCDAEADETRGFGSLMNAIRLAEVELGVDIDIDLGPIQRRKEQPEGYELSEAAVAVGSIRYRSGKVGTLMYLKAAAARHAYRERGSLPVHVAAYLRENPNFPHQSTIDQFFDDAQFESYRALGYQIAEAAAPDLFPPRRQGEPPLPPAPEPGIRVEVKPSPKY